MSSSLVLLYPTQQFRDSPTPEPAGRVPSETGEDDTPEEHAEGREAHAEDLTRKAIPTKGRPEHSQGEDSNQSTGQSSAEKGRKSKGEVPFTKQERDEMEALLNELCGHLGKAFDLRICCTAILRSSTVTYPTRFLEGEHKINNFLF